MGNLANIIIRQVKEFFGRLTRGQWIRLIAVAALAIAIIAVAINMFGRKDYASLYASTDEKARAAVYEELVAMGVDVKVKNNQVLVPADQTETLRLDLASKDLLDSGNTYELARSGMGMGSTTAEQKAMINYQLEQNLRATLKNMSKINDARVLLSQPESSVFAIERENSRPTASVTLDLAPDAKLSNNEVHAIANLVSAAVKDLKPEDVSIVDTNMHLYSLEEEQSTAPEDVAWQYDMEQRVQQKLREQVINLLSPIFGGGRVSASVNVRLNFDQTQQQSTILEPPVPEAGNNGIVISMKELKETINSEDAAAGQPGQDSNGGLPTYPYETTEESDLPYQRIEREANMEVNEIKTMVDKAQGRIEALSVSVIIDRQEGAEDYTAAVKSLVANALGIKDKTAVTVARMPFQTGDSEALKAQEEMMAKAQRNELIKIGIIALAALIVLVLLLKTIRDIFKPKIAEARADERGDGELPEDAVEGVDYIIDEQGKVVPLFRDTEIPQLEIERKRDEKQELIERLISEDPEIAAQLLRAWLSDE